MTARSAQSSGIVKCYVERFENAVGAPDLRLREKSTKRLVRVLTGNLTFGLFAPLSNLLQDCYVHGGGLVEPRSRTEYIAISAPIVTQNAQEIAVAFEGFSVKVHIGAADTASPPTSVWAYIEEYPVEDGGLGLRLRQKVTGRKIEIYGKNQDHLLTFLSSPQFTGAHSYMANLYQKDGFADYVLVSGGTATDSYDVLLFNDGTELTYLLGPTPDTAYRDAFRVLTEESAPEAHARTAQTHFDSGRYREAVLSARLAVETACGGRGLDVKRRLADAPADITTAAEALYGKRHVAVHEGETRVEQPDAIQAIRAMHRVLSHLESTPS
ncbi:hypothetical protein Q9S36_03185 [Microbacterium sp. ARD31]|uniref:hypothetical protein n=1 Tax=Microbacterium sp. ARD31 TaxID=2962576 RepID=UPI0028819998|nr:hypothetical protein [Microbacterium sp. ARD31]MDT0179212.1 hypothetical protein [Microbacterium sp. ARD31]